MERLAIKFSVLFIVLFLLLDRQLSIQTVGYTIESVQNHELEVPMSSTETDILSTDTVSIENPADIYSKLEEPESTDDDIIELNIGGQRMTTYRSTLTAIPNSKLAILFAKNNTRTLKSKDEQQKIYFFDYNSVQFAHLLDQLRTIKRNPQIPAYELNITAPDANIPSNFSYMLSDLGLNPEKFLSPLMGAHLNLNTNSLVGWQECYRNTYDTPFDLLAFIIACKSRRLLIACHPVNNLNMLTLAGVGSWQDVFRECSPNTHCTTQIKNGTSFYYVPDQAWGFEGRSKEFASTQSAQNNMHQGHSQNSIYLNPCDSSDQYSEYRLCWSLRSSVNRGGGDRCGIMRNLHNAAHWERVIYRAV